MQKNKASQGGENEREEMARRRRRGGIECEKRERGGRRDVNVSNMSVFVHILLASSAPICLHLSALLCAIILFV